MSRLNLVVVFGGRSAEHDVSCVTAAHVLRAVDRTRYDITAIGIDRNGSWHLAEEAMSALDSGPEHLPERLEPLGLPVSSAPVLMAAASTGTTVVLPLLHGPMGEDGTIQGLFELLDLPYVGSGVLSSAVCMDKAMAKDVLARHDVPQPRHTTISVGSASRPRLEAAARDLGYPLFVKPSNMGSSIGVSKVGDLDQFAAAVERAFTYDDVVVVEEAIVGREIEIAVLGNDDPRASVPGEIIPGNEFYDYDDKYVTDGATLLVPADLDSGAVADVQQLALSVFRLLRCSGLARIDFFYEEEGRGFLCNEVNTMPGFTPISMYPKLWGASGVNYSDLIDRLVELALERHARRRHNTER